MPALKPIFDHIDKSFHQHLEKIRTFVRQPSISGEGVGMQEMAELVAGAISELGGRSEIVPTSGWPVVYGEINAGRARTLLLYGMYDVQPVVGEDWIVPPFGGEIVEPEVHSASSGPRVVINPILSCGTCECCLAGEQSMCTEYRIFGEHTPGGMAD